MLCLVVYWPEICVGFDGRKSAEDRTRKAILHSQRQEPRVLFGHPTRHKLLDKAFHDGLLSSRGYRDRHRRSCPSKATSIPTVV